MGRADLSSEMFESILRHSSSRRLPLRRWVGAPARSIWVIAGRSIVAVFLVAVGLGAGAPSAAAHGSGGDDATNYLSTVDDPGLAGLEWEVFGGDSLLQLTNRTGDEVVVEGYEGEPYLRFVPDDGVYENTRSPATYLNQSRYGTVGLPSDADPDAPPTWRRISRDDQHAWHDHRVHWMSPALPPIVEVDPGAEHLVLAWEIPVIVGSDVEAVATGELRWIPSVRWWPAPLATGAVFLTVVIVALLRTRPTEDRWPGLARPVTVLLWIVIAANIVRTVDDMVAAPATVGQQLTLGALAAGSIGVILALSSRAWRGHAGGFGALAGAGLATVMIYGGEASDQLSASQLVTSLPFWFRRATVAASYTIAVPLAVAVVVAFITYARFLEAHPDHLRKRLLAAVPKPPQEPT